ncbi:hypothetical protein F7734_55270 [Scytonema sp. UIC 10036]|uniref:hypothetical protein n=1 Tax=Scytonema sp. UIC 10036 TaxID=2304196 RepID=UPI0012DAD531|nr:hypothetical protein [Scytonema sp. UIC 10036]MUH00946.1 hypothetical protein [Scytonema sp. UIC 10036]
MSKSEVLVICENPDCSKEFLKRLAEVNRSAKLGRQHFCSKSCYGKFKGLINFGDRLNKDTSYLRNIIRRDAFSPYRYHLKVMKKSSKHRKQECAIALEDLKFLWEKQKGICPYTGWELVLLPSTNDYENSRLTIYRASVDRIDSTQGYYLDNIQFVAVIANFAKNAFLEEDLINFCTDVYKNKNTTVANSVGQIAGNISDNLFFSDRRDKYSPFRQHLKLARRRVKTHGRECTITLEYLKELWEKQDGRCPYTGWQLQNLETTAHWDTHKLHPRTASLDRIDSSVGYIPGNVQFVSVMANFAKRDFQEEELLEFCKSVVNYRQLEGV